MQKGCKNQIGTAGRLLAVLDMRPSTTSNTTSNEATLLTAPSTTTLVLGPYLFPNYQNKDHKQAQTTRSSYPNRRPKMTRTRAPRTFTTMRATTSYIIISILILLCKRAPMIRFSTGRSSDKNTLPLRKQIMIHHRRNTSSMCSHAPPALPLQGNMDQGQAAPPQAAPPAQPAAATAPLVFPAPPPPLPALPAVPAPPAFALGPGRSHAVLAFDDPNSRATATKLYNKAIAPLEAKFDREADSLAVFLVSMHDRARHFNWHRLITMPIDDGTTWNLLTHYGQVSLNNTGRTQSPT